MKKGSFLYSLANQNIVDYGNVLKLLGLKNTSQKNTLFVMARSLEWRTKILDT